MSVVFARTMVRPPRVGLVLDGPDLDDFGAPQVRGGSARSGDRGWSRVARRPRRAWAIHVARRLFPWAPWVGNLMADKYLVTVT
jgi:hypothetical protein